jgi:hypothetical protein
VPVTAKLSRQFYERLGDEIANELVEWFNQMDATYKSELRELNELNFGRFRAELASLESRFDAKLDVKIESLKTYVEKALKEQTRFLILGWGTILAAVIGLWFR